MEPVIEVKRTASSPDGKYRLALLYYPYSVSQKWEVLADFNGELTSFTSRTALASYEFWQLACNQAIGLVLI